nr:hypothetical protein [Tanacetum cinerariifolium]
EYLENSSNAIAPILPTEEPKYSLSMGDEHLSTILKMESDKVIKYSVKNLVSILSESEVTSDNENTLIDFSPKFDYLLEEFSGELAHIDPIPPRIEEADFDLEEEIRLVENLLYDNSSPQSLKELNAEIADTIVESLSPSPIPVEDSDSQIEEIDLFLDTDDLMPPGSENDDYDSEGDIHFLEELLSNDSLHLSENESSNFDHHDDLSFPRPPPKPLDVEFVFDFEPHTGVLTAKMVEDISENYNLMPKVLSSQPTLCPDIDTLLPFSSENEDKVFKPAAAVAHHHHSLLMLPVLSIDNRCFRRCAHHRRSCPPSTSLLPTATTCWDPAYGRCLFRAIAHMVVDELLRRRKEIEWWFIEGDFDHYVKMIEKPFVWGREPELLMASHILKICDHNIRLHIGEKRLLNIATYGKEYEQYEKSLIKVLFYGYGHYENIELRLPIPLSPNNFMSDESDEGDAHEDVVGLGDE